ncbi:MAG: 16S rRNA (cytosine(1402)-N(4))-methyltransferase, partial [Acidobacteriota bacterium]|nr:16S rRNA (cytosine(1402)-N(4))-methyltransferase [Acidobacteriota bacterium]
MPIHHPVMPVEALAYLDAGKDGLFIDATLGLGGHSELILQASLGNQVIGFDRDAEAIELAEQRLAPIGQRFEAVHSDYRRIKTVLQEKGIGSAAGILADLGVSSFQFDTPERGFSFRFSGSGKDSPPIPPIPIDMRMDRSQGMTAAELVNRLSERELADIIFEYGEER